MTLEEMQEKFEKLTRFRNRNFKYKIASLIMAIGLVFFLSSNALFDNSKSKFNTPINKVLILNDDNIALTKREYNPNSGLLRLDLNIKNDSPNSLDGGDNNLKFDLIEKSNTTESLPIKVISTTENKYVIYANLKEWSAVALKISEKDNTGSEQYIKIYSDKKETPVNEYMQEENQLQLNIESVDYEINSINDEINQIDNNINSKNNEINTLENNINKLNEDKKYQTDNEKIKTDSDITSAKQNIETIKTDIDNLNKNKDELKARIDKLNEKKSDLEKNK